MTSILRIKNLLFYFLQSTSLLKFFFFTTILCTLVTLFFYFPDLDLYQKNQLFYDWINNQIHHPFEASSYTVEGGIAPYNHFNKRMFRLTVPFIARILHLSSQQVYLSQFFLLPLFFFLLAKAFLRITLDRISSFLLTFSFCFLYPSKSFVFYLPMYDCFAYLLLVVIYLSRIPILTFLVSFSLAFCDERAIIASFLLLLLRTCVESRSLSSFFKEIHLYMWILALGLCFGIRHWITHTYGIHVEISDKNGVGLSILKQNFGIAAFCVFSSLEGWWIMLFAATYFSMLKKQAIFWILSAFSLCVLYVISLSVIDVTRSAAYAFVCVFAATHFVFSNVSSQKDKRVLSFLLCLACAFIPTYMIWGGEPTKIYWLSPAFPKILKFI